MKFLQIERQSMAVRTESKLSNSNSPKQSIELESERFGFKVTLGHEAPRKTMGHLRLILLH